MHTVEAVTTAKGNVQDWVKELRSPGMIDITDAQALSEAAPASDELPEAAEEAVEEATEEKDETKASE
ncbi:hypothetical protein D3C73_1509910 [compost metagenome]